MRRALAFLTPLGGATTPTTDTLLWFPAAGALIGLAVGLVWWGAAAIWPPTVAAAIAVAFDLAITGILHVDGLADTADGLLPPVPRERRLEIMADPRVGAFGVTVVVAVLLLRWTALASTDPAPLVVTGLWCASRSIASGAVVALPYARPGGLATEFRAASSTGTRVAAIATMGTVLSLVPAAVGAWGFGVTACAGCAAAALALIAWARSRLGGFTGDILGAAIVVGETTGLLLLAVR